MKLIVLERVDAHVSDKLEALNSRPEGKEFREKWMVNGLPPSDDDGTLHLQRCRSHACCDFTAVLKPYRSREPRLLPRIQLRPTTHNSI